MPRRRPPRHDRDARGDPGLLAAKAAVRADVWHRLTAAGAARFPGAEGRIPNFAGAAMAADRLRATEAWGLARAVKANPDSPQWPVRQRALEDGKLVFMAVPRLAEERPFTLLDPAALGDRSPRAASSIRGAAVAGRPVDVADLEPVDLVVTGCVAAAEDGARLGKGGGFSDLELAVAAGAGLVGPSTRVVTTVHELQLRPAGTIPVAAHDLRVDLIATPDRVIEVIGRRRAPVLDWSLLTDEKIAAIPLLRRLRALGPDR